MNIGGQKWPGNFTKDPRPALYGHLSCPRIKAGCDTSTEKNNSHLRMHYYYKKVEGEREVEERDRPREERGGRESGREGAGATGSGKARTLSTHPTLDLHVDLVHLLGVMKGHVSQVDERYEPTHVTCDVHRHPKLVHPPHSTLTTSGVKYIHVHFLSYTSTHNTKFSFLTTAKRTLFTNVIT